MPCPSIFSAFGPFENLVLWFQEILLISNERVFSVIWFQNTEVSANIAGVFPYDHRRQAKMPKIRDRKVRADFVGEWSGRTLQYPRYVTFWGVSRAGKLF